MSPDCVPLPFPLPRSQELPDLEALHLADPEKPIIFMNLNLETHRGDLGLPAFPSKDLHYRFLSQIKPAYFLRTRQYSQTLSRPPFILNYQGAVRPRIVV